MTQSIQQLQKDRDDLLAELEIADKIIRNGYILAMSDVKASWATANWRWGVQGKDQNLMRMEERNILIMRARDGS